MGWCAATRMDCMHACTHCILRLQKKNPNLGRKESRALYPVLQQQQQLSRPAVLVCACTYCVPAGTAQARSGKTHRDPNRSSAASPMNDRHGHAMPGGDDDWLSSLLSPLVVVTMSVCLSTDGQDESPIGFIPPGLAWKQHTCWGWGWKGEPSRGRFIGRCNPESADQIWPALV